MSSQGLSRRRQPSKFLRAKNKKPSSHPTPDDAPRLTRLQHFFITCQPFFLALRALILGLLAAAGITRDDVAVFVFFVSICTMLGALLRVYMSILKKADSAPVQLPSVYRPDGAVTSPPPTTVKDHDQRIANYFASEFPALAMAAAWLYLWASIRAVFVLYAAYIMYRISYHPLFRIHLFNQPHCAEFERPWGGAPLFQDSPDQPVKVVAGATAFDQALHDAGQGKLVVVDFSAAWCGPCKLMAPMFKQLAEQFSDCVFLTVDIDVSQDVAAKYTIQSVPTFILFKDGERVELITGASPRGLREAIERQL